MRSYPVATLAALQARSPLIVHLLLWAVPRNRTTGLPEPLGFWSGRDHRSITVDGSPRDYYGAGSLGALPAIVYGTGNAVRMTTIPLVGITPEAKAAIDQHDARFAPVEIHRVLVNPLTGALTETPHRVFAGFIDDIADATDGGENPESRIDIILATSARRLTRTLQLMKSDESQRLRSGDRFNRYAGTAGTIEVKWQ